MTDSIRRRRNTNSSVQIEHGQYESQSIRSTSTDNNHDHDNDQGGGGSNLNSMKHFLFKLRISKPILALMILSFVAGCICSNRQFRHNIPSVSSSSSTSTSTHNGNYNSLRSVPSSTQFQFIMGDEYAPTCSSQPLTHDQVSVTLVTQTSEDRLWMMEHHCSRWGKEHFISIAVHTHRTKEAVTQDLVTMGCHQKYIIVSVVPTTSGTTSSDQEYPINKMRNVAIAAAVKTSHVFYVDIDFWTSQDLSDTLDSKYIRQAFADDDKLAIVVPALAIYRHWCENDDGCDVMNVERMPMDASDKSKLRTMVETKELTMFDPYNPSGHQSTGYHEWLRQKGGTLRDIQCIRSNRYEPYVVFRRCDFLPPFQEAFTGYGKNKMTWAMHIRHAGWKFKVLGDGFVVHFPHNDSPSRLRWNQRPKLLRNMMRPAQLDGMGVHLDWKAFKRGQIDSLYLEFKTWLNDKVKNESRVSLCKSNKADGAANDDDGKLWINRRIT